jgi:hypothetical protein
VDEKGKVATFLFTEGNEKVWLHLVVVWEKHREGIEEEEEEEEDEGMKNGARHKAEEAIVQKPSCCSLYQLAHLNTINFKHKINSTDL